MDIARIGGITFVSVVSAASGYILVLSTHGAMLSVIHPTSPDPVGTYVVALSSLFLLRLTLAFLFFTVVVHSRPHVHHWIYQLGYYTCRDSELGLLPAMHTWLRSRQRVGISSSALLVR